MNGTTVKSALSNIIEVGLSTQKLSEQQIVKQKFDQNSVAERHRLNQTNIMRNQRISANMQATFSAFRNNVDVSPMAKTVGFENYSLFPNLKPELTLSDPKTTSFNKLVKYDRKRRLKQQSINRYEGQNKLDMLTKELDQMEDIVKRYVIN